MQFSSSLVTITSLLALTASAVPIFERAVPKPYFAVTNFSWSKNATTSSYAFNVTFPQYVQISNVPANQPIYAIPAFKDPVTCTGTLTSAATKANSTMTTALYTCTQPKNKNMEVKSVLDSTTGQLSLTYIYHANINGQAKDHVYQGSQNGLKPVAAKSPTAFNVTVTSGPGVSS